MTDTIVRQRRFTMRYSRTENGLLEWTTSSIEASTYTWQEAWECLARRAEWLPQDRPARDKWDRAYGRPERGGWTPQEMTECYVTRPACPRCRQAGCHAGWSNPHE